MMRSQRFSRTSLAFPAIALLAVGLSLAAPARAAQTDISSQPIASTTAAQVKPNVMLLMDASGSMGYTHMPDDVELVTGPTSVGYKSSQCNALYFDPGKAYVLPRRFDGVPFAPGNFIQARNAGFGEFYTTQDLSWVSLATGFRAYVSLLPPNPQTVRNAIGADPAQAAYYYMHSSGAPTLAQCQTPDTGAPNTSGTLASNAGGTWTRTVVGAAEQQNFANWYSYYRTRIALLKSAASLAFTPLTDTYRVGFITVSPKADPHVDLGIQSSKFLRVNDFNVAHRELWFDKLFSQTPGGSSPAREGLARVGRYYAGQEDGINTNMRAQGVDGNGVSLDPIQYSCQRNFTILTTDGYWNAQAESDYTGTQFGGPVRIDGKTKVGQQDGDFIGSAADGHCPINDPEGYCRRPVFDGNTAGQRTVRDAWLQYDAAICALPTTSQSIFRTVQTRSRWTATYERTTRRVEFYSTTNTRNLATYTNTLLDKKKIKQTTEQYVRTTATDSRSAYQIRKSENQSSRTTTQQTTTSSQAQARTYQISQVDTRQPRTSVQNVENRMQTSMVTVQNQMERRQFTLERVQTRKRVYRTDTKLKIEEYYDAAPNCGPPATHDCQIVEVFPAAYVDPDPVCVDSDAMTYPYLKTRCTAGPATQAATPVASCSPGTTNTGAPNWVKTICLDNSYEAPKFVASCVPGTDASQIRTICTKPAGPNNTTVTGVDPSTCMASGGSAPDYIATSCPVTLNQTTYPNTACSNGIEPGYIVRTCTNPPATNFSDYVSSCTATTLVNNQQITCGAVETLSGPAIVDPATCTTGPIAGPAYRTCTEVPGGSYPTATFVPSCNSSVSPGPAFITQVCVYPAATNYTNRPVTQSPTCTDQVAGPGNNHHGITCNTPVVVPDFVPPGGCTPNNGTTGPNFVKVECNGPVGVGMYASPTLVDPSTCTANPTGTAPNYVVTVCDSTAAAPWPTCANFNSGAPDYIQYVCGTGYLVEPVSFCTVGTTYPSPGVTVTCEKPVGPNNLTNSPTPSCADQAPNVGNSYVSRTCVETVTQAQAPAAACSPYVDGANEYEITSCVPNNPLGTAYVDTCADITEGGPQFRKTTCSQPAGPGYNDGVVTAVPSCTSGTTVYDPVTHVGTTCTYNDSTTLPASGGAAACPMSESPTAGNGYKTITCNTFASQAPATTPTCNAVPPSAPLWEYKTCTPATPTAGPTNSTPCSDFVDGNEQVTCTRSLFSGPSTVACTPGTVVGGGPNYDETVCSAGSSGSGQILRSVRTVTETLYTTSGGAPVKTVSSTSASDPAVYYGSCSASVTLPSPNPERAPPDGSCSAWPCVADSAVQSDTGSKNSLADVANYYYKTDLRDGKYPPVLAMTDNVSGPVSPDVEVDSAKHQHMSTYVLGLGISGTLKFHPDYWKPTNTLGDFPKIRAGGPGGIDWPVWPDPAITYATTSDYENPKSIDDFWHTAVNGRGRFFNASDTAAVVSGLNSVLTTALENPLSGAGDAASSFSPVSGVDDFVYRSTYTPKGWKGDLEAFNQNDLTGGITGSLVWSADANLVSRVQNTCDDRKILFFRNGTTLVDFKWNTDTCVNGLPSGSPDPGTMSATEKGWFAYGTDSPANLFSHYPSMTTAQRLDARGANLVNFLRGQKGLEDFAPSTTRLFRKRVSVLGDFVNSQPVFVGKPFARYVDADYPTFVSNNLTRRKMLYIGGNDGMLHAFDADTGAERWAVIPSVVMPSLYKLADPNYDYQHEYFVDGTPVVGDVKFGSQWKTIVVVGLNKGGKGYMALDVTNPEVDPVPLWEFKSTTGVCSATLDNPSPVFSDCNLGLSFGKPVITRLQTSVGVWKWVVLVTSGYNNLNGSSNDGGGFVYAIDAQTGAVLKKVPTSFGDATTPSGLAQINNFVDDAFVDNTTLRAYGGDLLGNIFRIEFMPPAVKLLGTAKDPVLSQPQPITTRPELAELNGKPMVFVGTGKLLGSVDIGDKQVQSVYGIVDPMTPAAPPAAYEPLRDSLVPLTMVQTGYQATAQRTISCTGGSACNRTAGWVLDLKSNPAVMIGSDVADEGERINVNMQIAFGTLVFASNVPTPDPCNAAGHSYFTYLDWRTGLAADNSTLVNPGDPNSGNATSFVGNALVSGFNLYRLQTPSGGSVLRPVSRNLDRSEGIGRDIKAAGPSKAKRISWREIVTQ